MRKNTQIILTVTNDLNYDQRMIRICTSLSNAGYNVLLVGRIRSFSKPLTSRPFDQIRLNCIFNQGKLFYIEYNIRLFVFLLFRSFNIISAVDLDTLAPAYVCAKIRRKICVYDAHEYFSEVPEVVNRPAVKRVWEALAQWLIPNIQHCYTVGQSLADELSERYQNTFAVIRNLPWRSAISEAKPLADPPILLYQGVLNDGRGLEAAIGVLQQLENVELWLAGEGDLSAELRTLAKELGVAERIQFLGYLTPEALKDLTPQATIGLNLLENKGLNYYYSLAIKAFDYIQASLPAIHMDYPEYKMINEEYQIGKLIEDLKPATLQRAIEALLDNPQEYEKIRQNCRLAAQELIWEKEEKKLLEIYFGILKP